MRAVWILAALVAASVGRPAAAQDLLILEWADHARDPTSIIGDPVYKRLLSCKEAQGVVPCDLIVVAVFKGECPLHVDATAYKSGAGDLRVRRTGDTVDIEVDEVKATTRLRLALRTDSIAKKIVEEASGVMVFKPMENSRLRTAELVAYVRNSKGLEKHPEHAAVELGCSRMWVTAGKRTPN
jgi:hypothetical protein